MGLARFLRNSVRRIRRDGFKATIQAFLVTLRPNVFYVYRRVEPAAGFPVPAWAVVRRGLESLREARARCALLPDEFYYDDRPSFRDCFIAWCDSMPAGILWLIAGPARTPHMVLSAGQAELCGLYVLPPYRGRGLARALVASACGAAQSAGSVELYAVVEKSNLASQRCCESLGFGRVGTWRRVAHLSPLYRSTAPAASCA